MNYPCIYITSFNKKYNYFFNLFQNYFYRHRRMVTVPFSEIGVDNDYRAFMIASRRIAARYLTLQGKGSRGVQNDSSG